jgi:hypothetical protein
MRKTEIDEILATIPLSLAVACCAINVFNLDQTGKVKPNLIAINHSQQGFRKRE